MLANRVMMVGKANEFTMRTKWYPYPAGNKNEDEYTTECTRVRTWDLRNGPTSGVISNGIESNIVIDFTNISFLDVEWAFDGSSNVYGHLIIDINGQVLTKTLNFLKQTDSIDVSAISGNYKLRIVVNRGADAPADLWKELRLYSIRLNNKVIWLPENNL